MKIHKSMRTVRGGEKAEVEGITEDSMRATPYSDTGHPRQGQELGMSPASPGGVL